MTITYKSADTMTADELKRALLTSEYYDMNHYELMIEAGRRIVKLSELVERIQAALGTEETGDNLVAVARDAHTAEQAAAARLRNAEDRYY